MKQHKTVYSYWLKETLHVLSCLGLDIDELTSDLPGLRTDSPQTSSWIEVGVARTLWHNAFRASQDRSIGFKVGSQLSIRAFNVLAPVLSHSPSRLEAVQNAMRYQQLLSQSGQFRQVMSKGIIQARYQPAPSHVPLHYSQVDSVMAGFVKALRLFISEDIELQCVRIPGPERDDIRLYEDFYRCPVLYSDPPPGNQISSSSSQPHSFDSGVFASIELSSSFLNESVTGADQTLYRINKALAEDRLSRLLDVEQLHASVAEAVADLGYARADIQAVASVLELSVRTLQRKLSQTGTGFRGIQEQVILKETTRLLEASEASIHEIALLMGYTEVSSFSRAIKALAGQSPRALRLNPA